MFVHVCLISNVQIIIPPLTHATHAVIVFELPIFASIAPPQNPYLVELYCDNVFIKIQVTRDSILTNWANGGMCFTRPSNKKKNVMDVSIMFSTKCLSTGDVCRGVNGCIGWQLDWFKMYKDDSIYDGVSTMLVIKAEWARQPLAVFPLEHLIVCREPREPIEPPLKTLNPGEVRLDVGSTSIYIVASSAYKPGSVLADLAGATTRWENASISIELPKDVDEDDVFAALFFMSGSIDEILVSGPGTGSAMAQLRIGALLTCNELSTAAAQVLAKKACHPEDIGDTAFKAFYDVAKNYDEIDEHMGGMRNEVIKHYSTQIFKSRIVNGISPMSHVLLLAMLKRDRGVLAQWGCLASWAGIISVELTIGIAASKLTLMRLPNKKTKLAAWRKEIAKYDKASSASRVAFVMQVGKGHSNVRRWLDEATTAGLVSFV
jgi:hypothetical protein